MADGHHGGGCQRGLSCPLGEYTLANSGMQQLPGSFRVGQLCRQAGLCIVPGHGLGTEVALGVMRTGALIDRLKLGRQWSGCMWAPNLELSCSVSMSEGTMACPNADDQTGTAHIGAAEMRCSWPGYTTQMTQLRQK